MYIRAALAMLVQHQGQNELMQGMTAGRLEAGSHSN